MATVADRIRAILQERGWSQRELARRAGYPTSSQLGNTLRRLDKAPDSAEVETLRRIAIGAGVSFDWLMTGVGSPEGEDAPAPSNDGLDVVEPRVGNFENWDSLRATAKALDPSIADWALDYLATTPPLLTTPPSPALIAELAKVVMRHMQPPKR